MRRSRGWSLIVAVVLLVVSFAVKGHWLSNGWSAQILWRPDEAYLVVGVSANGWRMSWPMLMIGRIASFGVPLTHRRLTSSIFRITSTSVERYDVNERRIPDLGATGDYIHDMTHRWKGDRFEPMTPDEIKQVKTRPRVQQSFDNVDGWSKRTIGFSGQVLITRTVMLNLAGQPAKLRLMVEEPLVSRIALQRGANHAETLWSQDGRFRRVSRSEFDLVFGPSSPDR